MFFEIVVLKKFTIFNLCRSLFLISKFIKKRLQHSYFPVNTEKYLRPAFFKEHLWLVPLFHAVFWDMPWNGKILFLQFTSTIISQSFNMHFRQKCWFVFYKNTCFHFKVFMVELLHLSEITRKFSVVLQVSCTFRLWILC